MTFSNPIISEENGCLPHLIVSEFVFQFNRGIIIRRCTDAVSYQRRRDREAHDRTDAGPVRVADAGPVRVADASTAAAGRTMKSSSAASEEVHVLP